MVLHGELIITRRCITPMEKDLIRMSTHNKRHHICTLTCNFTFKVWSHRIQKEEYIRRTHTQHGGLAICIDSFEKLAI